MCPPLKQEARVVQVAYTVVAFLCSLAVWLLPTIRMSRDLQYFLKTGLYNNEAFFSSPQLSLFLAAGVGVGCLAYFVGPRRAPYQCVVSLTGIVALGIVATTFGLYLVIYSDLAMAKLRGAPTPDFIMLLFLGFEIALLMLICFISSIFAVARRDGFARFQALGVSLSATGLSKSFLLLTAPSIPVWGLSWLTCNGPCL